MNNSLHIFPQYRMLSNEKVFYKIESDDSFVEVQFMGEKKMIFHVKAEKYPEKLRIMDMLECAEPFMMLEVSKFVYFDEASS